MSSPDHTAPPMLMRFPSQAQKTMGAFFKATAAGLGDGHREVLNVLARALTERGWVVAVAQLIGQLAEHRPEEQVRAVVKDLAFLRLIDLDEGGDRVQGILGCLSVGRTPHRGHLENGVDVFTHGGFDLLSLNAMLLRRVDCFTTCGQSGVPIRLTIADDQVVAAEPNGIAAFRANWDGEEPLSTVAANSPLFASDTALDAWRTANPHIEGTELPADLLLWLGLQAAQDIAAARFKLIGREQ